MLHELSAEPHRVPDRTGVRAIPRLEGATFLYSLLLEVVRAIMLSGYMP